MPFDPTACPVIWFWGYEINFFNFYIYLSFYKSSLIRSVGSPKALCWFYYIEWWKSAVRLFKLYTWRRWLSIICLSSSFSCYNLDICCIKLAFSLLRRFTWLVNCWFLAYRPFIADSCSSANFCFSILKVLIFDLNSNN